MLDAVDYQVLLDSFGITDVDELTDLDEWPSPCPPQDEATPYDELTAPAPLNTEHVVIQRITTYRSISITTYHHVIRTRRPS